MTTVATSRKTPTRPQWLGVAGRQLRIYLHLHVWLWVISLVGIATAIVVVDRVGTVDLSIAQFVRNGPLLWFLLAVATIIPTGSLTPHVANGVTRRAFTGGSLVAALANSLLQASMAVVVMALEGALYAAMGWQHDTASGSEPAPGLWEQGYGILLLDYSVGATAGTVSGLLVGLAYYRFGGLFGTLGLPLALAPVLVFLGLSSWGTASQDWLVDDFFGVAVTVGVVLAGAAAFALLLRNVRITRTET